ncbi:hypothetical protein [Ferruginibacter albus]|uniref:hypothetical protein n=1 Tax=Ferruginibacter albus TaxID=2875540 RepID=UPI001CC3D2DD|nr:hypothetical protein [Ferruginibacter albus]UAY51549.1 hypothetical protein K9M53_13250 [Ferruginibacter albus]
MKLSLIIYYIILFTACILSVIRIKHDRRLLVFAILLITSLSEELLFEVLEYKKVGKNFYFIYHFFAPVYYGLFAYYFSLAVPKGKIRNSIRISIPLFTIATLAISFSQESFKVFPGVQLNIIGVLLIINSLIALFQLDVRDRTPLLRRPIFWISISTLFFYSVLFSLNGFFNYLMKHNFNLAVNLYQLLNNNLNYLYYLLIIIGMLCSKPIQKYSLQSS